MWHTQVKLIDTYLFERQIDLGEFRTRLYFEQFKPDGTVNHSARQGSGHVPNAVSLTRKVIGAIKTSSTDNIVKKRQLFIQAVSNFPWFDEVRVSRWRLCSYESCTACSLIWHSAGRQIPPRHLSLRFLTGQYEFKINLSAVFQIDLQEHTAASILLQVICSGFYIYHGVIFIINFSLCYHTRLGMN